MLPNTSPESGGLDWFNSTNVVAQVKNGGAVVDTAGENVAIANSLYAEQGSTGGLLKLGAGTLTLTAINS